MDKIVRGRRSGDGMGGEGGTTPRHEQQDDRLPKQSASDGDALALAVGELYAVLPNHGVLDAYASGTVTNLWLLIPSGARVTE
jgi:hypothetical protein